MRLLQYRGVSAGRVTAAATYPGYMYGKPLEQFITVGEKKSHESFKNTDHFGGEMKYFSDCILNGRDPEPDGEEAGLFNAVVLPSVSPRCNT